MHPVAELPDADVIINDDPPPDTPVYKTQAATIFEMIHRINTIRYTVVDAISSPEKVATSLENLRKELAEKLNSESCDPALVTNLAERYAQYMEDKLLDEMGLITLG